MESQNSKPLRYHRRIIRIRAEDSPNVRLALAQLRANQIPMNTILVPGVLTYSEYKKRRLLWDKIRQCIGLDAEFYEGAEILMFPPEWLNLSAERSEELKRLGIKRQAKAIGIDPAEGGDKTAMSAVDDLGLIEQKSKKTPDTNIIVQEAIDFARKHQVPWEKVCFDRGGGGKQHADRMRAMGYPVKTVSFGESLQLEARRGPEPLQNRKENVEERYAYYNRRSEMYGELRLAIDPSLNPYPFAIGPEYYELRRQLAPIPLTYDPEGRLRLLPKNKRNPDSKEKTLTELIGCSPDEADSLAIAHWIMNQKSTKFLAGAAT